MLVRLSQRLNANPETALASLDKQIEQIGVLEKQVKELHAEKLELEAEQLAAKAEQVGAVRLCIAPYQDKTQVELRQMGSQLQNEPGLVAILASYDGSRVALVVSCAVDTGMKANELIKRLLTPLNGKGGGDARLAQGGGSADKGQFEELLGSAREIIKSGVK